MRSWRRLGRRLRVKVGPFEGQIVKINTVKSLDSLVDACLSERQDWHLHDAIKCNGSNERAICEARLALRKWSLALDMWAPA